MIMIKRLRRSIDIDLNKIRTNYIMKSILFSLALLTAYLPPLPTIILINGIPHFVILDEDYYINLVIQSVPDYFESELTHEAIVRNLIASPSFQEKTSGSIASQLDNEEVLLLENVEFIQFLPNRAILDRIAVDRIRGIAQQYTESEMTSIYLKISHQSSTASKALAENRIYSVKDLLMSFGVDQYAIITELIANDRIGENSFVRVDYGK